VTQTENRVSHLAELSVYVSRARRRTRVVKRRAPQEWTRPTLPPVRNL
jgi:hypothetical protein